MVGPRSANKKVVAIPTAQNIVTSQTAYLIIACSTHQRICTVGPVDCRHYIFLVCVGNYAENVRYVRRFTLL
ncbi:hypothetical protein EMIT043CA1_10569 [Pseudomonas brassicacearum]